MNILNQNVIELIKFLPNDIITEIKNGNKKTELIKNFSTSLKYNRNLIQNSNLIKYFTSIGITDPIDIAEKVINTLFDQVQIKA